MCNDPGRSRAKVDDGKQARAALLCAALGGFVEVARSLPSATPIAMAPPAKHAALKWVVETLSRDPTLSGRQLAASAGISQKQVGRLFRSEFGVSLPTYRNWLRIEKLQALLDGGRHNLSEAARMVGFGSYSQFHRVFQAAYGVGPRNYRRAAKHS
jgi:transcriptional regulator GlxA family with amidase domain